MKEGTVQRWSAVERLTHWMLTIGFLAALVTALPLFDVGIFGFLSALPNFWARNIHLYSGFLLAAAALLHVGYRLAIRKPTSVIPSRKDFSDLGGISAHWFNKARPYPELGFHHPSEKIVYWGAGVLGLLMMGIGGFLLWQPSMFPTAYIMWAIAIKDVAFFVMSIIIVGHVLFGLASPASIKAMFGSGKVTVSWAGSHHGRWLADELATQRQQGAPPLQMGALRASEEKN